MDFVQSTRFAPTAHFTLVDTLFTPDSRTDRRNIKRFIGRDLCFVLHVKGLLRQLHNVRSRSSESQAICGQNFRVTARVTKQPTTYFKVYLLKRR